MLLFGIHACKGAIEAKKEVSRIYILKGKSIPVWASKLKSKTSVLDQIEFEKMLPNHAVHQGIAMEVEDVAYADIVDLEKTADNCAVAILDGVTDPHNVGAIIRTAATFGIKAIILSEKSSCKINGTVAKAASGGIEHVSIIVVKNLSQAIDKLKSYGFWVVSFCERGDKFLHEIDLKGKTCLIFGSEGDGIRRLQKENSDFVVKLPTKPEFPTMNVSTSAAIAFYEAAKQNDFGF